MQAGDARSFSLSEQTGDADRLLCQVGSVISAGLPGRLPRKELFEAHAVASVAMLGRTARSKSAAGSLLVVVEMLWGWQ